jgi:hypothetical protein
MLPGCHTALPASSSAPLAAVTFLLEAASAVLEGKVYSVSCLRLASGDWQSYHLQVLQASSLA